MIVPGLHDRPPNEWDRYKEMIERARDRSYSPPAGPLDHLQSRMSPEMARQEGMLLLRLLMGNPDQHTKQMQSSQRTRAEEISRLFRP